MGATYLPTATCICLRNQRFTKFYRAIAFCLSHDRFWPHFGARRFWGSMRHVVFQT